MITVYWYNNISTKPDHKTEYYFSLSADTIHLIECMTRNTVSVHHPV